MNHRIPVLLDGDPGHDDAIAWMLAATGLDIRGVSSAAGNQVPAAPLTGGCSFSGRSQELSTDLR